MSHDGTFDLFLFTQSLSILSRALSSISCRRYISMAEGWIHVWWSIWDFTGPHVLAVCSTGFPSDSSRSVPGCKTQSHPNPTATNNSSQSPARLPVLAAIVPGAIPWPTTVNTLKRWILRIIFPPETNMKWWTPDETSQHIIFNFIKLKTVILSSCQMYF